MLAELGQSEVSVGGPDAAAEDVADAMLTIG
jgi:hypothetical protein